MIIIMIDRYVIDTCALISFYDSVFTEHYRYSGSLRLSPKAERIIYSAIYSQETHIRMSIPSVVFIEIHEKWLDNEEFCKKFFYEVFSPIISSEYVEIRPMDKEVLENLLILKGELANHEIHDRLVLASAMTLNAPLITSDKYLTEYINLNHTVPDVFY